MYLLYVDESGSPGDPKQSHFILAGLSVFERQTYWISKELDRIAANIYPADPSAIEFHGNPMYQGKGIWRKYSRLERVEIYKECLQVLINGRDCLLFACVANKYSAGVGDPLLYAFEQLCSRFDMYLARLHKQNNTQRGIMIFDKSSAEETFQNLATDFRTYGHSWGVLQNLAEVPLFIDSKASRMVQLVDMVAYAIFRNFEHNDDTFYSIINNKFDFHNGQKHELHLKL